MRRQHDDAEQIAAAIMARLADCRDEYDAIPIVRMLHKLNALLRVHFAYEEFRAETTRLFAALGARIERENDHLFPLARRMLEQRPNAGEEGRRKAA